MKTSGEAQGLENEVKSIFNPRIKSADIIVAKMEELFGMETRPRAPTFIHWLHGKGGRVVSVLC